MNDDSDYVDDDEEYDDEEYVHDYNDDEFDEEGDLVFEAEEGWLLR